MEDSYRKKMTLGDDSNALIQLVVINAVLFVILKFIYVIYVLESLHVDAFYSNVLNWFVNVDSVRTFGGLTKNGTR